MEELNKTQVVLLALFITFVTSVATGIVTVTLLQQAPTGVTQTINRVVERTIEKVTPVVTKTETTTKIVEQEDQIIQAAALVKPAIARIVLSPELAASLASTTSDQVAGVVLADSGEDAELGTGFVISSDGLVVTAYSTIPDQSMNYGVYIGDKKYSASVLAHSRAEGLSILKIDHDKAVKFFVPTFASRAVVLGQTVIVLGRDLSRYTVSVGLVSSLREATAASLPSFKTTVKSDVTNIGGPLLNSDGAVIGLNLESGAALPFELIKTHLGGNATTTKTGI